MSGLPVCWGMAAIICLIAGLVQLFSRSRIVEEGAAIANGRVYRPGERIFGAFGRKTEITYYSLHEVQHTFSTPRGNYVFSWKPSVARLLTYHRVGEESGVKRNIEELLKADPHFDITKFAESWGIEIVPHKLPEKPEEKAKAERKKVVSEYEQAVKTIVEGGGTIADALIDIKRKFKDATATLDATNDLSEDEKDELRMDLADIASRARDKVKQRF